MSPHRPAARTVVLGLAACLWATGCKDPQRQEPEVERNLKALAVCFGRYVSQNRGQGPPNEAEFKKFIRSQTAELEGLGLTAADVDGLFVSPRDNQPFEIAWKATVGPPGPDGQSNMIIWEKTGLNGKRYVANGLVKIEEIDEATFQQRQAAIPKKK